MTTTPNRRIFLSGLVAAGGVSLAGCRSETYLPPDYGSLFGVSDALSMGAQRLILQRQPLAREFAPSLISRGFPAIGTTLPEDDAYLRDLKTGFATWSLPVEGLVRRPLRLSLAVLKAMPARTQVTAHSCERGWTAIGQWTGVPLAHVLRLAGLRPEARYIVFDSVDGWYESLDLFDALHPQTILAHGMNGAPLPVQHGAPVRLRVERHLGYKSIKFINRIRVVESMAGISSGKGSLAAEFGYSWYAGI
ncbi:molybdopterin-dependent oxidoreductase [Sphingomonas colocasiae]|uniref:Molybdopterin-dependent oxidoreductase n=1 Tax=Sphingomonas colocasiae TaxID=1848973 RepID=A0ABS7PHR6_9SPHN|nr:molybdopterin-dependent oxidoreductase [Sphingomonas colocasiae]MBY8820839.1 molybdopterin-dependent oxidoreductase [Sphingomonas colocasiae]